MDGSGQIKPDEMSVILTSMNNTASYFGDKVMTKQEVSQLVEDVFATADVSHTGTLSFQEYMQAVVDHPVLVAFIMGEGTVSCAPAAPTASAATTAPTTAAAAANGTA